MNLFLRSGPHYQLIHIFLTGPLRDSIQLKHADVALQTLCRASKSKVKVQVNKQL